MNKYLITWQQSLQQNQGPCTEPTGNSHLQEPIPAPETEEKSPSSWTEQRNTHHSHTSLTGFTALKIPRNYCSQAQGAGRRNWKDLPPANVAWPQLSSSQCLCFPLSKMGLIPIQYVYGRCVCKESLNWEAWACQSLGLPTFIFIFTLIN